jgi:group I intron endonuclease
MYGIIYLITNKVTGKRYVGQTISTIEKRWSQHKCESKRKKTKSILHDSIKKYGENSFEIKILVKCNNLKEMNYREDYCIKLFKTLAPNGLNLKRGGENRTHTEESKKRMSVSQLKLNKKLTEEQKKRISDCRKGKKLSLKHIEKVKASLPRGENHHMFGKSIYFFDRKGKKDNNQTIDKKINSSPKKHKILCIETNEIFRSIREASRKLGLQITCIRKVLKGERKTTGGLSFKRIA